MQYDAKKKGLDLDQAHTLKKLSGSFSKTASQLIDKISAQGQDSDLVLSRGPSNNT